MLSRSEDLPVIKSSKIKKIRFNSTQRAGIADGGEFEIRPPGTATWLFDKVKY